jgi:hypothetical protein
VSSNIIYKGRIKSLIKLQNNVNISCEDIVKIMTPNISKQGFIEICTKVINTNLLNITSPFFNINNWIKQTIYNVEDTTDFVYNMSKVVKDALNDRIINKKRCLR